MNNQVNRIAYLSAIVLLLSAALFVGCESKQDKNAEEATESATTIEIKQSPDWQAFKTGTSTSITNNDERIKALREKIKASNTPNIDKLREKRINELQDRNTALRARLMEYKDENDVTSLEQFMAEVRQQLDEMEKELKELDN